MEKVLILRVCRQDRTSYNGFQWPESGPVEAPDWSPEPECGHGLHGLLWGEGNSTHLRMYESPIWQVIEVEFSDIVDLDGKVKFPRGEVIYTGTREGATGLVYKEAPNGTIIHYLSLTGGNHSTLTGGYGSTLTGGHGSTLTGGDYSTLTGGNASTLIGGYRSALTGGNRSTLTGGNDSMLTGGNFSRLTGGDYSKLTGGDDSTLTGGHGSTLTGGNDSMLTGGHGSTLTGGYVSTLTGGDYSTLTGGNGSTLTGGNGSVFVWVWLDNERKRVTAFEVGKDGVEPNVPYTLIDGKLKRA